MKRKTGIIVSLAMVLCFGFFQSSANAEFLWEIESLIFTCAYASLGQKLG
jgi:hypothetical protein